MTNSSSVQRLQKFLARAGVASRRKCEEIILSGRVSVNGSIVRELGTKVDSARDVVLLDGKELKPPQDEETVVLLLNKPAGYLSAMSDPREENVVSKLVPVDQFSGLFPVGRLDKDTTGALLFTNNGELGNALLHPSRGVLKRYEAIIEGELSFEDVKALESGVELDDGPTAPAHLYLGTGSFSEVLSPMQASEQGDLQNNPVPKMEGLQGVAIEIHEGRKRQVRRMFAHVGHPVVELRRTKFGPIELGDLKLGKWRKLDPQEVSDLEAVSSGK